MTTRRLRFGRYEVGERLGKGSFGIVHLARDLELGREVAIKFLKPEYLPRSQMVQRFLQEARAAAKIDHPGIVTVFECGLVANTGQRIDGTAFIAMERLIGETLADRLHAVGTLSVTTAIAIARQVASALAAAHAANIVHRDLKPDNVYLVPDAHVVGGERVKIVDFGVAKLTDPDAVDTQTKVVLGTPRYMAPEQARSAARADSRADIYAFGCILFEMVSGAPPFGGDMDAVITQHQAARPAPLRDVPPALAALVARMLEKDPEARPASMIEVDRALAEIRDVRVDNTTTVRRTPLGARKRRDRRVPVLAAVAAALVAGAVTFLALRRESTTAVDAAVPVDAGAVPAIDAVATAAVNPSDRNELYSTCVALRDKRRWNDLMRCAHELGGLDKKAGMPLYADATREAQAEVTMRRLTEAVRDRAVARAHALLAEIPESSVYHAEAAAAVTAGEHAAVESLAADLRAAAAAHDCKRFAQLLRQEEDAQGKAIADEARKTLTCTDEAPCDADDATRRGNAALASTSYGPALAAFEQAYACKPDKALAPKAFMAACRAKHADKARTWFARLPEDRQGYFAQICVKEGIDVGRCDADAAMARGDSLLDASSFAAALDAFEQAARCNPDKPQLAARLYMAACRAKNARKARVYFGKLPAARRDYLLQLCLKDGIDPR